MNFYKHAIILATIDALHKHGSWTGKTHLQKALSLLETVSPVAMPFEFTLYKHGPYSFDVETELEQMKSYAAITALPVPDYYGVVLRRAQNADYVNQVASLDDTTKEAIERICAFIGKSDVKELEKLATAAWIRAKEGIQEPELVAERLHELKPHISVANSLEADEKIRTMYS